MRHAAALGMRDRILMASTGSARTRHARARQRHPAHITSSGSTETSKDFTSVETSLR